MSATSANTAERHYVVRIVDDIDPRAAAEIDARTPVHPTHRVTPASSCGHCLAARPPR